MNLTNIYKNSMPFTWLTLDIKTSEYNEIFRRVGVRINKYIVFDVYLNGIQYYIEDQVRDNPHPLEI